MSRKRQGIKPSFSIDITSPDYKHPAKKLRSSSMIIEKASPTKISFSSKNRKGLSNGVIHSSNWIDTFAPLTIDDLAVHPKKIQEVKDWLLFCEANKKKKPGQMCLITGPSGVGKTATIKVLSKQMNYQLIEWINPIDTDSITILGDQEATFAKSQAELFKAFLFRSSRYKSVLENSNKRLILVEDFPNAFLKDPRSFTEILQQYKEFGKSGLVFIVTDSKSKNLNISYNLFPDTIQAQFQINHISFNPASATLIKKALKQMCSIMTEENLKKLYKPPSADTIESIGLAAQGDIRNALINLHFGSLKGAPSLSTESVKEQKLKTKAKKQRKLSSVGRDESITMMHALGRVFHPKYTDEGNLRILLHPPEDIASAFSTEPKNIVSFIHANYLGRFSELEDVLTASESLSLSDQILNDYRDPNLEVIGLNVAVRAVMISNRKPVGGWMPIRGPKRITVENSSELRELGLDQSMSPRLLASDYRTFVRIIKKANASS